LSNLLTKELALTYLDDMSKPKVHARFKKGPDFELHLRTLREDGVELVELRDYIPSEKWYGRGVSFEPGNLPTVIEELQRLAKFNGGSAHPAGSKAALKLSNSGGAARLF
jgi:hypothetical protein